MELVPLLSMLEGEGGMKGADSAPLKKHGQYLNVFFPLLV